jgi:hypothetical protein
VLGLSTTGRIYEWASNAQDACVLLFTEIDGTIIDTTRHPITEKPSKVPGGIVKVVSGWHANAAYLYGRGIAVWGYGTQNTGWDRLSDSQNSTPHEPSALIPLKLIPGTGYLRDQEDTNQFNATVNNEDDYLGEVIDFVSLENDIVVFLTDGGHVYASKDGDYPVYLRNFSAPSSETVFTQIEGSFRNFALMNISGSVYLGNTSIVEAWLVNEDDDIDDNDAEYKPIIRPALQNRSIVSITFGDYHFLAMTASGRVIGFGHEPGRCGCLGLGRAPISRNLRGIPHGNGELAAPDEGIDVLFSKHQLAAGLILGGRPSGAELFAKISVLDHGETEFGAQFAYSIAAGGWMSAALVLVDEKALDQQKTTIGMLIEETLPGFTKGSVFETKQNMWSDNTEGEKGHGLGSWLKSVLPIRRKTNEGLEANGGEGASTSQTPDGGFWSRVVNPLLPAWQDPSTPPPPQPGAVPTLPQQTGSQSPPPYNSSTTAAAVTQNEITTPHAEPSTVPQTQSGHSPEPESSLFGSGTQPQPPTQPAPPLTGGYLLDGTIDANRTQHEAQ